MAIGSLHAMLVSSLLMVGAGCLDQPPWKCSTDESCAIAGQTGARCLRAGDGARYCAFNDVGCPSQLRWDDSAAPLYANQCVAGSFSDGGMTDASVVHDGSAVEDATMLDASVDANVDGHVDANLDGVPLRDASVPPDAVSPADAAIAVSPTVATVIPSTGPTSGGTSVSISGTNFQAGATVTFNGVAATGVSRVSPTKLLATTPANAGVVGKVDVVVSNPDGTNGGAKAFGYYATTIQFSSPQALTVGNSPTFVLIDDFNRDGINDLVVAGGTNGFFATLLGTGGGAFTNPVQSRTNTAQYWAFKGDLNGDSKMDVVVGGSGAFRALGDGAGQFATPTLVEAGAASIVVGQMVPGDLNGDGKLDFIYCDGTTANIWFYLGNGDGTFSTTPSSPVVAPATVSSISLVDLNGDQALDVVAGYTASGNVGWFLGDGVGDFGSEHHQVTSESYLAYLEVADIDHDGRSDVLAVGANLWVLKNSGQGLAMASAPSFPIASKPATCDLNGDGFTDIVGAANTGGYYVLESDANGSLTQLGPFSQLAGKIFCADLDNDNKPDLVAAATLSIAFNQSL